MTTDPIRLTQYSHGAGCGCKIAPDVLTRILQQDAELDSTVTFPNLVVGHQSRDDAAAVKLNEQHVVLSTTDFFMPIVDDPYQFGRIAATNAISDIYARGGETSAQHWVFRWRGAIVSTHRNLSSGWPLPVSHCENISSKTMPPTQVIT